MTTLTANSVNFPQTELMAVNNELMATGDIEINSSYKNIDNMDAKMLATKEAIQNKITAIQDLLRTAETEYTTLTTVLNNIQSVLSQNTLHINDIRTHSQQLLNAFGAISSALTYTNPEANVYEVYMGSTKILTVKNF